MKQNLSKYLIACLCSLCIATTSSRAVTITGTVHDDGDGGTISGNPSTLSGLFVNIVKNGSVVGSSPVSNTNGTYSITVANAMGTCKLILTSNAAATTATFPAGPLYLVYTAEGSTAAGDGIPNGSIDLTFNTNLSGYNFAVNRKPSAPDATAPSAANLSGTARFIVPALNGSDPEGLAISYKITSLPNAATMGTLYYNGTAVVLNQVISGYIASLLTVDPVSGTPTVTFTYTTVDAAGATANTDGTVTMPFSTEGFPCDAITRFTRQITSPSTTTLSYPNFTGSNFTVTTTNTYSGQLNASVYYKGYMYAMQQSPSSNVLLELHADNTTTSYTITGMPSGSYNNAGVSANGMMYILNNYTLYTIDLNTKTYAGSITCTGITDAANVIWGDIAVAPSGSVFAWYHPTAATSTAPKGLYRLNTTTGVLTKVGNSEPKTMGSLVFDNAGNLYAYGSATLNGSQDRFFQIDTVTGSAIQVGVPDLLVSQSDGCSCAFSVSLQISSSAACLYANENFTNYFTIKNLTGGGNVDGVTFVDTLNSRFSYNYTTPADITALETALKALFGPVTTVSLGSYNGGTNNFIMVNGMSLQPGTTTFSLSVKTSAAAVFGTSEIVNNHGYLLNLPGPYGTLLKSDDPNTAAVGDATAVGNPSFTVSSVAGATSCATLLIANRGSNYGATYTYQWYLNGVPLPGATGQTYLASTPGGPYTVRASSADGCVSPLSPAYTVQPCISGTVYDDATGLTDGIVNGTGTSLAGSTQLYVTLWSTDVTPAVIQSVPVNTDGTYSFPNVPANTNYNIYLSTTQFAAGSPGTPATTLPTGWVNVGEFIGSGSGSDGNPNGILPVALGNSSISNVNLGIDNRPTANTATGGGQVNPGGTVSVTVPAILFSGSDAGDLNNTGSISAIRITAFPAGATSFTAGTTTYYSSAGSIPGTCPTATCSVFNTSSGLTIATNAAGNPISTVKVDPSAVSNGSSVFTYAVIDNAGIESSATATVTMPFTGITLSGNVYNDVNGTSNSLIDGAGIGTSAQAGQQLYMNLIDNSTATPRVAAVVTLPSSGAYSFSVSAGTYSLVLSTTQGTVNSTIIPSAALPSGWVNTAEGISGSGDGTVNGVVSGLVLTTVGIGGINFGIDNLPTPVGSTAASQSNPGGTNSVTVPSSAFKGTDAGDLNSSGSIASLKITSFPSGSNTITINGNTYNAVTFATALAAGNTTVPADPNGLPLQTISVDPSFSGAGGVTIPFAVIDKAGMQSSSTANVVLPFTDLTISGTVYRDADGAGNGLIDGTATDSIGSNMLYANLVNPANGKVISSVAVNTDGTYVFGTANGVAINTTFNIVLTNGSVPTGTVPSATLMNAANTSEGPTPAGDGTPDGIVVVTMGTVNITGVDFGVDLLPDSDTKTYDITSPKAHAILVLNGSGGLPGPLTGSDPEDGTYTGISGTNTVVISPNGLNGNKLFYSGAEITNDTLIRNYNPALLSVKFEGSLSTSLSFTYAEIDAAGKQDPTPATYSINWITPLPVSLISFDAVAKGHTTWLTWSTSEERNADFFSIERSADGMSFKPIGNLKAAGNSRQVSKYSFTDQNPLNGRNYYRLRTVDVNGGSSHTGLKIVSFSGYDCLSLYPNPATDKITVHGLPNGTSIRVLSTGGKLMANIPNASNIATIGINQWPPSNYVVQIISESKIVDKIRFVKL